MLLTIAISFVVLLAISVGAVEYADRTRAARRKQEMDALRRSIEWAAQKHQPRKQLRKQYVEVVRKELANG